MKKNLIIEQDIKRFCEALDINYQIDFVKKYETIGDSEIYGGKHCGSAAEHEGSKFIADKLREIGLSNVELIPCDTAKYQFNDASIEIEGKDTVIKPYGYVSPGTAPEGMCVWLSDAVKARKEDLEKNDISGKAVLIAAMGALEGANLSGQIEQVIRHGAAAVIIYAVEDVLNEETIRVQPPNIICSVPVVGVCMRDAEFLKKQIAEGGCRIRLTVDAEFIPESGTTYNVVGEIPGRISDECIIYTAHLDHYFRCLQDNMSSCSTLLGIAKAMIDSGYRPDRTIVFAFHGSHETGGMDTRYPYIFGSYKLTHYSRPEWTGKAILNINFEYTALRMKKLQVAAYPAVNSMYASYFPYSPELTGRGFSAKEQYPPQTEYYMLSWSDCISYHDAGIPTLCNDPISEQYYEGTGPYVGRDHSNFDNWEIFDADILGDIGRFYGGMGIYIAGMPYIMLDYTEQTKRIRNEINRQLLNDLDIPCETYFSEVDRLENAAEEVNRMIREKNEEYIEALSHGLDETEKKRIFDEARKINIKLLAAYKEIADDLDKINAEDFMCLATVKYMQNAGMLMDVKKHIENGDTDKALEILIHIDLAAASLYFDREVVEHMRKQICDPDFIDRRTWAAGRELSVFTYHDLIQAFIDEKESGNRFDNTLELLEKAVETETAMIPRALESELECIRKVTETIISAVKG